MTDAGPYVLTGYWAKEYARVQSEVNELRADLAQARARTAAMEKTTVASKVALMKIEEVVSRPSIDVDRSSLVWGLVVEAIAAIDAVGGEG